MGAGYGLLGEKLGHSYSPEIHKAIGGYDYRLIEVEPENLGEFLTGGDFDGINITIPYKQAVMPFCAEISQTAREIGSVNTILRRRDGSLYGENTDAAGFGTMIERLGVGVADKKSLILGSGGSSLTVRYILGKLGAREVVTVSRGGVNNYENIHNHRDAQIIINATPVGMYPETSARPIDLSEFPKAEGVLDLIYNPARTRLLQQAGALGLPYIGGLSMLVAQAGAACELFTGQSVPPAKIREVLADLSRKMENIIFIGMPGSGKTSIGGFVAKKLERPFVDLDEEIERRWGLPIPEIFSREGETGFREKESMVLAEVCKGSGQVIATGGGCVTRQENHPHLRQNGVIVFIKRELNRLPMEGRPLSLAGNLDEIYRQRKPLYLGLADLCVHNNTRPEKIARRVIEKLSTRTL